jgi:hypothetical protein
MNIVDVPSKFIVRTNHEYPPYNNKIFEEYFLDFFVNNNIESEYIYLPILWTNLYISRNYGNADMNDIQMYLDGLDKTKKYFTVIQYDDGILQNIDNLNIIVFGQGGGGQKKVPDKNLGYPIPLNCMANPHINKNRERDIFCSFVGVINGRHPIREKIKLFFDNDFMLRERVGYDIFKDVLERSVFSLCPRGYGATSFRICESLQHGSIPVYIYDKPWIPWNEEFDFESVGVLIPENKIENIKTILSELSINDIEMLRNNGCLIYKEYFDFEGCAKQIIKKLKIWKKILT